MKIKKKTLIWALLVAGLAVVVIVILARRQQESPYVTEKVRKTTLANTISVTGEMVAQKDITLNFEVTGRLEDVLVKEGDEVATGEVLAVIADQVLSKEVERSRAALDQAIANEGANDDAIREAKQTEENAEDYLAETEALEDQRVDAAHEAYSRSVEYYEDAVSYYDKVKEESGSGSSAAKSAKLTATTAANNKNAAEEAWQTAEKTRDLNVTAAENSRKSAKERRKSAQSQYARTSLASTVRQARANYEMALANLEKATLKAPVNGIVTKVNYEPGEVISSMAQSAFGALLSQDYLLEVDVPESDVAGLETGQTARVTFDALSLDDVFMAEVIEIEPASTVIQDVVYYRTKLKLDSFDPRLKPGMSLDADIETLSQPNTLVIPQRAVKKDDDLETVELVDKNGQLKTVSVQTGASGDEGLIEIKSGLEEGQEVVVSKQEED